MLTFETAPFICKHRVLTYPDITCHVFILFCGIKEIHKILGLREGMEEEDRSAAILVDAERSPETLVPTNQNKHRVVIKKIEILVHKYI